MNNILVTGGLGFIGSNLIKAFVDRLDNIKVYSIDNNFTADINNRVSDARVEYMYGDTSEISTLMNDKQVDTVYHLAEYSRIVPSFEDIDLIHRLNVVGTFKVLRFCIDRKCKLIYAASSSKFGDSDNQNLSPYAWIKAKNTELIKNFGKWYDLDYSISYFYNVYGNNQILDGKYSAVIGRFMRQFLEGKELTVVYPGTQSRDFTCVSDIVDGLILLINKGSGKEFQFGTGKNYSLIQIAEAFDHPYIIVDERRGERFTGKAVRDSSIDEIGWRAKIDVLDYIREFVKTVRQEL
jgi:UDP-glucose 4-epimerase